MINQEELDIEFSRLVCEFSHSYDFVRSLTDLTDIEFERLHDLIAVESARRCGLYDEENLDD